MLHILFLLLQHNFAAHAISEGVFDQLVDHTDPGLGFFKQRFWYNPSGYKQGGPIILYDPGEQDASVKQFHYVESGEPWKIAQALGGMAVVIEQRYQGRSLPFNNFSVPNLKFYTTAQTIADNVRFSKKVDLKLPYKTTSTDVPWFLSGVSASGATAVFTRRLYPDVFAGVKASSAVIISKYDSSQYYEQILVNSPRNCSNDLKLAMHLLDSRVRTDTSAQWEMLAESFGMSGLRVRSDLPASMIEQFQVYQNIFYIDKPYSPWYAFCDFIELSEGERAPGVEGRGAKAALERLAAYKKQYNIANRINMPNGPSAEERYGTWSSSAAYTDTSPSSARALAWQQCNEYAAEQVYSAELRFPSIFNDQAYFARQCRWFFGEPHVPTKAKADAWTRRYGGLDNAELSHIFWVTGEVDPFKPYTVDAARERIPRTSEYMTLPGRAHGEDTWADDSGAKGSPICKQDFICKALHPLVIKRFGEWATEWYARRNVTWHPPMFVS